MNSLKKIISKPEIESFFEIIFVRICRFDLNSISYYKQKQSQQKQTSEITKSQLQNCKDHVKIQVKQLTK